jgi:hypothetical protein
MNGTQQNIMFAVLSEMNGKYDSLEVRLHSFNIKWAIPAYYEKQNK